MPHALKLTLISRRYCHLCHEMEVAVIPLLKDHGVKLEIVDVDSDPFLEDRYGEFVPVLLHDEFELSRFHLDIAKVSDYLKEFR